MAFGRTLLSFGLVRIREFNLYKNIKSRNLSVLRCRALRENGAFNSPRAHSSYPAAVSWGPKAVIGYVEVRTHMWVRQHVGVCVQ